MARVTIEDGIDSATNRFRLVMCGAQRGRELASGVEPTVERDREIKNEKNAVIALREITQGNLDMEALEDSIVSSHRRFSPIEAAEEEGGEDGESGKQGGGQDETPRLSAEATAASEVLPEIHAEAAALATEAADEVGSAADVSGGSEVADEVGSAADVSGGSEVADEAGSAAVVSGSGEAAEEVGSAADVSGGGEVADEAGSAADVSGGGEAADEAGSAADVYEGGGVADEAGEVADISGNVSEGSGSGEIVEEEGS